MSGALPEFRILVAAARAAFELSPEASRIPAGLDWKLPRKEAARHGMSPLLLSYLRRAPAGAVPEWLLPGSREDFRDRPRYGLGRVFTPPLAGWEALTLPAPLFPRHYLCRPARLLAERVKGRRARSGGTRPSGC